jgi:hypothetical protein
MFMANAISVARTRVGDSSSSHPDSHECCPFVKKIHGRRDQEQIEVLRPHEQDRRHNERHGEEEEGGRLRPKASARKARK